MIGVGLIAGACVLWALDTLIRYPLLFGGTSAWTIVWLEHLMLVAVLAWGASTVFGKQLSNSGFGTRELMAGRFLTGFLVLTPCLFLFSAPLEAFALPVVSKVLIMVLVSGLGGMALYYLGMRRLPARSTAIAEMIFPIAAVTTR